MFIWTHDTMEVTQFYLHLPSNSSLDKFPNNTLTEYHVGLPQTVSLTGDWEVALTEIHYPHSWNNVQGNFGNRFFLRNQELSGVWEVLIIPPGHYSSIEDILSKMKGLIENVKRFNDDVTFSYDAFTRKVTVHLQNNVELFFGNIGYLLGFSPEEIISNTSTAERQVDLEYGFHDLFIYCDLIQSQYCWRCTGTFASNCSCRSTLQIISCTNSTILIKPNKKVGVYQRSTVLDFGGVMD